MTADYINSLIKEAHENAVKHGFWKNACSDNHYLCLVLCELAEAVEAVRKSQYCTLETIKAFEVSIEKHPEEYREWFELTIKDTLGDELADAYIRLCDLAGAHGLVAKEHNGMRAYVVSHENTFTENIMAIASVVSDASMEIEKRIFNSMSQVERLAELNQVDLVTHVGFKMRYNALRAYKHGKAF